MAAGLQVRLVGPKAAEEATVVPTDPIAAPAADQDLRVVLWGQALHVGVPVAVQPLLDSEIPDRDQLPGQ
eukprot:6437639-Lingulodinium_polyedra.AAC.1